MQGLIFVGKTASCIMLWIQSIYLHNYSDKETCLFRKERKDPSDPTNKYRHCGSFKQIFFVSIFVTSISYSYNLWLSSDFQWFIEKGTFSHWLYVDIFKYFLLFEIFLFKDIKLTNNNKNNKYIAYFFIIIIIILLILNDIIFYLLSKSINKNNKFKLMGLLFVVFNFINIFIIIISLLYYINDKYDIKLIIIILYAAIPSNTLLSFFYKNFVKLGLLVFFLFFFLGRNA